MEVVLNIALSSVFAGLAAVGVTVAIERFGGTVGGVIGTLPSTVVPASIGLALRTSSLDDLQEALYAVPVGSLSAYSSFLLPSFFPLPPFSSFFMHVLAFVFAESTKQTGMTLSIGCLFLWRVIPPHLPSVSLYKRLSMMIAISLLVWLVSAILAFFGLHLLAEHTGVTVVIIGPLCVVAMFIAGVLACLKSVPSPKGTRKVGMGVYFARALLAGGAIGICILLAHWEEVVAGITAAFPAIFLTSMVGLWISQGEAVPSGAVGPMMLGSTSVGSYPIILPLILSQLSSTSTGGEHHMMTVVISVVITWFISACFVSLPIFFGLRYKERLLGICFTTTNVPASEQAVEKGDGVEIHKEKKRNKERDELELEEGLLPVDSDFEDKEEGEQVEKAEEECNATVVLPEVDDDCTSEEEHKERETHSHLLIAESGRRP
ncbi:Membrane transporter protein [Balamuthia mandrillaris]